MPDVPYPLTSDELAELKPQILEMFRDIYENRVGGAELGDVFRVSGDTFQLSIKAGCGLQKTNGQLDFDKTVIGTTAADISNTPSGTIAATNVQDAINELDTEKIAVNSTPSVPYIYIADGVTEPDAVVGKTALYIDSADYWLKVKFSNGTVVKIVEIGSP